MLLGLWLRARYAADRGLWLDEYGTLWAARGDSAAETATRVRAVHGQSALYYLVERGALAVLGESEARLRWPGIVLGALVPLLGYLGAARAFGRPGGAAALVLLAFDPRLIHEAENARPYALAHASALLAFVGLARALETGAARDRAIAWSGAVLSVYAHYVFAPIVAALVLGVLASEKRAYGREKLVLDAGLAAFALVPALGHMASLAERRRELAWGHDANLGAIGSVLPSPERWLVLAGAGFAVATARTKGRGALVFAVAGAALAAGGLLAFYALGSDILDARYMALGAVAMPLVAAWAIASIPRPLAALALAFIVSLGVFHYHGVRGRADLWKPEEERKARSWDRWGQEWRAARAALDARAPAKDEPVLLWTGFIESDLLAVPGRVGPELRGFLVSPLEDQPGRAPTGYDIVPLTYKWNIPGQPAYFESELVPRLDKARRFFVVAHPGYEEEFARWLAARFPGRFVLASSSRTFVAPVVVQTYFMR